MWKQNEHNLEIRQKFLQSYFVLNHAKNMRSLSNFLKALRTTVIDYQQ